MIESPLLKNIDSYIDGGWVSSPNTAATTVRNPATGEVLAEVPDVGADETTAAVLAGERAMGQTFDLDTRRRWLNDIADAIESQQDELGRIITLEQGKPLKQGAGEASYAAGFYRYAAEHLDELEPETLPETVRDCRWSIRHTPTGVAGLITPWNFPLAMLAKKLSAAIAAGCASVTKPAPDTPLTAIAFWSLLDEIGLPAGMASLVVGPAEPIGRVLCEHPAVRVVSFTGSTGVGKKLLELTAPHVKKLSLELGGNAPLIVFEDADLEDAADKLITNKFRASGQTCVCTNRVFAHEAIADDFAQRVAERVGKLRVGDGMDEHTDLGPLINRVGFDKVAEHVRDALGLGATRIVGDEPPRPAEAWGAFYPPTVLVGVTTDMQMSREETFGPIVGIHRFETEAEVIDAANGTPYGLAAYVFTADADRADRVATSLRFGHVGINTATGPAPQAPFGGMKQSGFGREGGIEGLFEFCETQVLARG